MPVNNNKYIFSIYTVAIGGFTPRQLIISIVSQKLPLKIKIKTNNIFFEFRIIFMSEKDVVSNDAQNDWIDI